ncbi:unnamed protein product [Rotaria sordida]|uniref:FAM194 C-terminal domain-containing protein n=1 Tax=Rotaria sordida TaxID=392033 RepID=A0A814AQS4_9BILA|nr:unnamed protein product [Rotaria sordida]
MKSSSSRDVDLLFFALHQANIQCSEKSTMRSQMSRGLYFYDQFTRTSHIGGIHRYKRHPEELNQALHHVRIALAAEDDQPVKPDTATPTTTINPTPSPVKQQLGKQTNELLLRTIERKLKAPIVPDALFKDLDSLFQRFDDKSKTAVSSSTSKFPSSIAPKSAQSTLPDNEQELDTMPIQEADDEDELIAATSNTPKISLPGSLIIRLHSTWTDLIENTEYKYKTWQTKTGEDNWRRYVERKRLEQLNAEKNRAMAASKQSNYRQGASRTGHNPFTNLSRQQQLLNPQMRSNRSLSRVSFMSTNTISQLDHIKTFKPIHQGSLESLNEPLKSGIHVEFKLSTQVDQTKQQQQSQIQALNEQKGVMFDVPKPLVDVHEDIIALTQARCKRLLAETKQRILTTVPDSNIQNPKICKVWYYGENHLVRNKSNLLTLNELARRQKSKFIFSILRREIPEKYNIDIEIPEVKHKCYLEMTDGSSQIYYPSGRLAVLRIHSPNSMILFFDDVDISENVFLGLVTSTGSVLIMQPTLHARFVTDNQHERNYLCNGKTGIIEKQIQWHSNNITTQLISSNEPTIQDEDDILPALLESTIQLQLNSYMQLEYHNPTNIRFAFACQKEEFKFQLGVQLSTISVDLTKKNLLDKKFQSKPKLSTILSGSINSNQISNTSEKQQIQVERLLDGHVNVRELPMIKELNILRKRIRNICHDWLKQCRTTLGVMDIDSYCLPDWPSASNQLIAPIIKSQQSKSAKQPRHITILTKNDSINNEFLQPSEREQIIRTHSANKPQPNLIANTIMQFIPRSDSGKSMKQKFYAKKNRLSTTLPAIKSKLMNIFCLILKTPSALPSNEERPSSLNVISSDLPFSCSNLIRQRLIQDGPISPILHDTCTCRADHIPIIHDLEFDTFIELIGQINPKQLIVIGVINSNLRQIEYDEKQQSNELYEILQTLHYHLNYGRSQISVCRLSTNDDYRCLIYDLAEATKHSSLYGPLLVRRHNVQPGFVLIYQHGQVIFGDSIFNGYGRNLQDLKKQLDRMRHQQIALPEEFKFISDHRRTNSTVLKSA